MSRFSDRYAVRKSAAVRRKRLLTQAFCRHSIQYEGAPAPSYSPCKKELLSFKQGIFDSLKPAALRGGLQAVEKVEHSWAFSHLYGKISMGDERCLNEGSWIVES